MQAVCVANDPQALADHQRSRAVAIESEYPLTPGKVYVVVGMMISERVFYFLVRDDWGGPCFAPAGFFEASGEAVPAGWRFGLGTGIRATGRDLWTDPRVATWGYPRLVDDPDHAAALLDLEADALEIFEAQFATADKAD